MRVCLVFPCLAVAALGVLSCNSAAPSANPKPEPSSTASPQSPPAASNGAPSATCPPTVAVAQSLSVAAAGWESFEDDSPSQLMSVGVFNGHPLEQASLVPDSDTESAGRRVAVWQLAENGSRRYWLACYYDHSRIALARMLASDITRVEVTRDPQVTIGGQPEITGITFK